MSKIPVIALIGKAGAGKDTVMQSVLNKDPALNEIISYTTRPPREGEVDGKDYHFVDIEKFTDMVLNDQMLEACSFNNWFYGTGLKSLDPTKVNIGVFNPAGIESLQMHNNIELYVFLIEAKDKVRLIRQLQREEDPDIDEIMRRFKTDNEDFFDLQFHHNFLINDLDTDLEYNTNVICGVARALKDKIGQFN